MPPPPPLPPTLPPPLLLSVGMEDDACYMNADSSPATSAHTICGALNACVLFDRPLPVGCAGGKGINDDGGTGGGGQSWIMHQIGMVPPSPPRQWHDSNKGGGQVKAEAIKRAIVMATRVASDDNGNEDGGKSNGNGNKGGGKATTRAKAAATTVAGNDEGNEDGNEGATKRVRAARRWQP